MNLHESINNTLTKTLTDIQDDTIFALIQKESTKKTASEIYHTDLTQLQYTEWERVRDVLLAYAPKTNSKMLPSLNELFANTLTRTVPYNDVPDVPTTYPENENILANPLFYAQCTEALRADINADPTVVGSNGSCDHISVVTVSDVLVLYYFCFDFALNPTQETNLDNKLAAWSCP